MQTVDDKTVISGLRLYASDQYESEQNEVDGMKKGADSTGKMMQHMRKERSLCG